MSPSGAITVCKMACTGAVALSCMATSCFLLSGIVLTPSPSRPTVLRTRVVAVTDSVVRLHGLKPVNPWPYCSVRGMQGVPAAAWEHGALSVTACAEQAQRWEEVPRARIEIAIRHNGYRWNATGKLIRQELPAALEAAFAAESIIVVIDPK